MTGIGDNEPRKFRKGPNLKIGFMRPEYRLHEVPDEYWSTVSSVRDSQLFERVHFDTGDISAEARTVLQTKDPSTFVDPMLAFYILNMAILFLALKSGRDEKKRYRYFQDYGLISSVTGKPLLVDTTECSYSVWNEFISYCMIVPIGSVSYQYDIYFGAGFTTNYVYNDVNVRGMTYLRLKHGLYNENVVTFNRIPADFYMTDWSYLEYYRRIMERYCIRCSRYTWSYIWYKADLGQRMNSLAVHRYRTDTHYNTPIFDPLS